MSVWKHLERESKRQRQERAVQKVEEHVKLVLDEAQAIGEMHREHGQGVE